MSEHLELYKYLHEEHVSTFLSGKLLFRNLASFQKYENDPARSDVSEGMHIDRPKSGASITNLTTGQKYTGDLAAINSVNPEDVYCLCLARKKSRRLLAEFGCSSCIKISGTKAFRDKIRESVRQSDSMEDYEVLCRKVRYYREGEPAPGNIKDPRQLPFFKPKRYGKQFEYRIVLASKAALKSKQSYVAGSHAYAEEARRYESKERYLEVGNLGDIAHRIEVL